MKFKICHEQSQEGAQCCRTGHMSSRVQPAELGFYNAYGCHGFPGSMVMESLISSHLQRNRQRKSLGIPIKLQFTGIVYFSMFSQHFSGIKPIFL